MPRVDKAAKGKELTLEERRERRQLRREKQREDNIGRAAKMHAARLRMEAKSTERPADFEPTLHVGCSGWRYWKWRDSFYADVPQQRWFAQYLKRFDTVEINASFYSWPTVANVQAWRRQPGSKRFVYTVKVCELITHVKRFKGTKTLIRDFGIVADILGERMGCFLFQLPPSHRYTKARLEAIVSQLDPKHATLWSFGMRACGTRKFTRLSKRPELSSAPAAGRAFPTSLSGLPRKFTSACTAPNDGIGTTTQKAN